MIVSTSLCLELGLRAEGLDARARLLQARMHAGQKFPSCSSWRCLLMFSSLHLEGVTVDGFVAQSVL